MKLVFSSILLWKDKKDISKKVALLPADTSRFIDNSNLKEHLGYMKLHLNKRGNSVLANNFMKYLRSSFWILDDFSGVRDFQTEYGSKQLLTSGINDFTNKVS